jgi:hypothetical protein
MFAKAAIAAAVALAFATGAEAQEISGDAIAQISAIYSAKSAMTPAQKKMDSALVFGIYQATNDPRVASFTNAINPLSATDVTAPSTVPSGVAANATSSVAVTIVAPVSDDLNAAIAAANGKVIFQSARFGTTDVALPVTAIASLAARADVSQVKLPETPATNAGLTMSQGYTAHAVAPVVSGLHIDGTGVTVGVLSDSATNARVAALKASGDLNATATSLPGQSGDGISGVEDEGAAMMEIIHDMAPGANLIFATADIGGKAGFGSNIIALAQAGCKVIVDDVSYYSEGVFQDDLVAQAINTVTSQYDVIYFSAAANSGNVSSGTSGTWEGDFTSTANAPALIVASEGGGGPYPIMSFGSANYDTLTVATATVTLHWSDPLGKSNNDYDLFVLNAAGTKVLGVGGGAQTGTQDPFEITQTTATGGYPAGSRIYVLKYSGSPRAMHLSTQRGALSIATTGATYGHNAGANTVSMAATYWGSGKTGLRAFTGVANADETFSSDGPRKVFYNPDGTLITPALPPLFASAGAGTLLQKPDLAAADGVNTRTPGFAPFFGTSAAAPHAAGIAALVRAARPTYTNAQVKNAMVMSALDNMATGVDRDSGYGITMANGAVNYAISH